MLQVTDKRSRLSGIFDIFGKICCLFCQKINTLFISKLSENPMMYLNFVLRTISSTSVQQLNAFLHCFNV